MIGVALMLAFLAGVFGAVSFGAAISRREKHAFRFCLVSIAFALLSCSLIPGN